MYKLGGKGEELRGVLKARVKGRVTKCLGTTPRPAGNRSCTTGSQPVAGLNWSS